MKYKWIFIGMILLLQPAFAMDKTQMSVWVNEALVSTYTYDAQNFLSRQKEIAKYFSGSGWIAYNKALRESKLRESVEKNHYSVSAVATLPPVIKHLKGDYWQAVMPLLVLYQNPNYKQTQTLEVVIDFTTATKGEGVRGLVILSLQAKTITPSCKCSA